MPHQPLDPHHLKSLANMLMVGGLLLLLIGVSGAYLFDQHLALGTVVASHALVILGPTGIKIGYVVRLLAQRQLAIAA